MALLRRIAPALTALCVALGAPAAAHAAKFDPLGFHLLAPTLTVHENAGKAVITVVRTDVSRAGAVRYITLGLGVHCGNIPCSATSYDFQSVKGMVTFPKGVAAESFTVKIIDHGVSSLPTTFKVALFGPWPMGFFTPTSAVMTIINDDPPLAHVASNPLGLAHAPRGGNPLAGARFFLDRQLTVDQYVHQYPILSRIADAPHTERFGNWMTPAVVGGDVQRYLARAQVQEPRTVPLLSTYYLAGPCVADSPARQRTYHDFIVNFARGIGSYRAVLFLEMDGLITTGCLSPYALSVRLHEINDAINILKAHCPRIVIYLDAGAADAVSVNQNAVLLRRAGVSKIQGFFLNSTHFDWTSSEIRYGDAISRLIGGKHFVVNTAVNGRGPLRPANVSRDGMEVLCNPPGRGLGPKPTSHTGFRSVDAFAWIGNPGNSGGQCGRGAPPTGAWWLGLAIQLSRDADFRVR